MTNLVAVMVWTVMCIIGAGWIVLALTIPETEPESDDGERHAKP